MYKTLLCYLMYVLVQSPFNMILVKKLSKLAEYETGSRFQNIRVSPHNQAPSLLPMVQDTSGEILGGNKKKIFHNVKNQPLE